MNNSVDDRWISLSDILRAVWSLIAPLEGIRLPHLSTSACILSVHAYMFISAYLSLFSIECKRKNLLHLINLGHKCGLSLLKNGGSCLSFTFVHIFLVCHEYVDVYVSDKSYLCSLKRAGYCQVQWSSLARVSHHVM